MSPHQDIREVVQNAGSGSREIANIENSHKGLPWPPHPHPHPEAHSILPSLAHPPHHLLHQACQNQPLQSTGGGGAQPKETHLAGQHKVQSTDEPFSTGTDLSVIPQELLDVAGRKINLPALCA